MDVTFLLVVVGGLFILGLVALVIVGVILFIVLGRNHLHLRSADKSSTGSPGTEFPMSGHDPAAPINPASGLPMVGGVDTAGNPVRGLGDTADQSGDRLAHGGRRRCCRQPFWNVAPMNKWLRRVLALRSLACLGSTRCWRRRRIASIRRTAS